MREGERQMPQGRLWRLLSRAENWRRKVSTKAFLDPYMEKTLVKGQLEDGGYQRARGPSVSYY